MTPPSPAEIPAVISGLTRFFQNIVTMQFRHATLKVHSLLDLIDVLYHMELPYHLDHLKNINCRTTSNNRTTQFYELKKPG